MVNKFEFEKRAWGGMKENSQETKICVRVLIQLNVDRDINFQKQRWKLENLQVSYLKQGHIKYTKVGKVKLCDKLFHGRINER
jgi:hypothetical protein